MAIEHVRQPDCQALNATGDIGYRVTGIKQIACRKSDAQPKSRQQKGLIKSIVLRTRAANGIWATDLHSFGAIIHPACAQSGFIGYLDATLQNQSPHFPFFLRGQSTAELFDIVGIATSSRRTEPAEGNHVFMLKTLCYGRKPAVARSLLKRWGGMNEILFSTLRR